MTSSSTVVADQAGPQSTVQLSATDCEKLISFHQTHFPGIAVPESLVVSQQWHEEKEEEEDEEEEDDLGYYHDGVKRSLTDEQIKLFRHSEIQRLLAERRQTQDAKPDEKPQPRKRSAKPARPFRFDDDPERTADVDTLMYDDEKPAADSAQKEPGARKFLWPSLGS